MWAGCWDEQKVVRTVARSDCQKAAPLDDLLVVH